MKKYTKEEIEKMPLDKLERLARTTLMRKMMDESIKLHTLNAKCEEILAIDGIDRTWEQRHDLERYKRLMEKHSMDVIQHVENMSFLDVINTL